MTVKINLKHCIVEAKTVVVTPKYAIENSMMPRRRGVSKSTLKKILYEYGREIKKMLLEGKSYGIGAHFKGAKRMDILLKKFEYEGKPFLRLKLETEGGKLNKRKIRIQKTEKFKMSMLNVPEEKRYLFPSL